jgi:hypothetical protein
MTKIPDYNLTTATGEDLDNIARVNGIYRGPGETHVDLRDRVLYYRQAQCSSLSIADVAEALFLNVPGVTDVMIEDDSSGRLHITVNGGEDKDIANTIHGYLPAGVVTFGTACVTVPGVFGATEIRFSRPSWWQRVKWFLRKIWTRILDVTKVTK